MVYVNVSVRKKLPPLAGDSSWLTVISRCLGCRKGLSAEGSATTDRTFCDAWERSPCRCLGVTSRDMYWDQPRQPLPFVFLGAYQRDLATTAICHSSKTVFLPWHPASFWECFSLHNSRGKTSRSIAAQRVLETIEVL